MLSNYFYILDATHIVLQLLGIYHSRAAMGPSFVLFFSEELLLASKSCFIDHFFVGSVLGTTLRSLRGFGFKSWRGKPCGVAS